MLYEPLLPSVVRYVMTLEDVNNICVEPFTESIHRLNLFTKLSIVINMIQQLNKPFNLWIDGSFVTEKPSPSDIDVIIVIRYDDFYAAQRERPDLHYQIFENKELMRRSYNIDIKFCLKGYHDLNDDEKFFKSSVDDDTEEVHDNYKGFFSIDYGLDIL